MNPIKKRFNLEKEIGLHPILALTHLEFITSKFGDNPFIEITIMQDVGNTIFQPMLRMPYALHIGINLKLQNPISGWFVTKWDGNQ